MAKNILTTLKKLERCLHNARYVTPYKVLLKFFRSLAMTGPMLIKNESSS